MIYHILSHFYYFTAWYRW